jgi:hypothetical protein
MPKRHRDAQPRAAAVMDVITISHKQSQGLFLLTVRHLTISRSC